MYNNNNNSNNNNNNNNNNIKVYICTHTSILYLFYIDVLYMIIRYQCI